MNIFSLLNLSSLVPKVLSFVGGWQAYLIGAVLCVTLGFGGGVYFEGLRADSLISAVQHGFDNYKIEVSQDVAKANQDALDQLQRANSKITILTNQLNKKQTQQKQDSETIKKVLDNATVSSPLSNPVKSYLSQLRILQSSTTH